MKQSKKSPASMRLALAKETLLGFDIAPGAAANKAGSAKSGSGKAGAPQKASVAKSGKSAAGNAARAFSG